MPEITTFSRHADSCAPVVNLASAQTIAYLRGSVRHWAPANGWINRHRRLDHR